MSERKVFSDSKKIFNGNFDEVVEVLQGKQAITKFDDKKPILATFGIGPCIAFEGWSPVHKIGFLAHYDSKRNFDQSSPRLFYNVSLLLNNQQGEFDVRITQGENINLQNINQIKSRIKYIHGIKLNLVEEDLGRYDGKSIALDTRTGERFSYDPMKNPITRDLTSLELQIRCSSFTSANLVYPIRH